MDRLIDVHIFKEIMKDEEMSSETSHVQRPLDLKCLRQESSQVCPQRSLSSGNA